MTRETKKRSLHSKRGGRVPLDGELRQLFRHRHTEHKGSFLMRNDDDPDDVQPGEMPVGGEYNFLRRVLCA